MGDTGAGQSHSFRQAAEQARRYFRAPEAAPVIILLCREAHVGECKSNDLAAFTFCIGSSKET